MYLPKDDKALLIFVASFSLSPVAPVLDCLSLPAKSTKFSLPTFMDFESPSTISIIILKKMVGVNKAEVFTRIIYYTWKIACDLELCSFILVAPVVRLWFPVFMAFSISLALWQVWECKFVTTTPSPACSLNSWIFVLFIRSKSLK